MIYRKNLRENLHVLFLLLESRTLKIERSEIRCIDETLETTLSRDRVVVRYRELRNQQSEHEHMQRST